jgi:hypothetical protein
MADALLDQGINGLSMAINERFGHALPGGREARVRVPLRLPG